MYYQIDFLYRMLKMIHCNAVKSHMSPILLFHLLSEVDIIVVVAVVVVVMVLVMVAVAVGTSPPIDIT